MVNMKYGFILPQGDALTAADFAAAAEQAGWDGFFVWEPVWGNDAWVCLTAAAMVTSTIRLGTMLSPVSRMRPWKLASETATLDNLSGGRVILSVGLGAVDTGFHEFGEETDRKTRAELLDEGLAILKGLWKGQPFSFDGSHYHIRSTSFHVPQPPVQQPRIPVWVVGSWPRMKSMRRVLAWDGLLPDKMSEPGHEHEKVTQEDLRAMTAWILANRQASTPFDVIMEGQTPGEDLQKGAETVRQWAAAGATWWLESMWENKDMDQVLTRIRQGPPRLA
jgi:hypothetical protein